jgi:hypothetical protein
LGRGRRHAELADAAGVALPGCAVASVCPKRTPDERGFFEQVRHVRGMIAQRMLERPPAGMWQASDAAVEGFVLGNLARTPIGMNRRLICEGPVRGAERP